VTVSATGARLAKTDRHVGRFWDEPNVPVEQERSQRRHEQILEAALRIFCDRGYRDTAVDDIALQAQTSKGGVYFHFPNKQAIFGALLDRTTALLRSRVEAAMATESDPIRQADIALAVVLETFASHRTLARLFLVEAPETGREFHERMRSIRDTFTRLIRERLDAAVCQEVIPPLDTTTASRVWFGALMEVVTAWVLSDAPEPLENSYPTIRTLLLRSIGVSTTAATGARPA
jgi:AcrR family transcriptional regulator